MDPLVTNGMMNAGSSFGSLLLNQFFNRQNTADNRAYAEQWRDEERDYNSPLKAKQRMMDAGYNPMLAQAGMQPIESQNQSQAQPYMGNPVMTNPVDLSTARLQNAQARNIEQDTNEREGLLPFNLEMAELGVKGSKQQLANLEATFDNINQQTENLKSMKDVFDSQTISNSIENFWKSQEKKLIISQMQKDLNLTDKQIEVYDATLKNLLTDIVTKGLEQKEIIQRVQNMIAEMGLTYANIERVNADTSFIKSNTFDKTFNKMMVRDTHNIQWFDAHTRRQQLGLGYTAMGVNAGAKLLETGIQTFMSMRGIKRGLSPNTVTTFSDGSNFPKYYF